MSIKAEISYNSSSFIERLIKQWSENPLENIDYKKFLEKLPKSNNIAEATSIKNITSSYKDDNLVFVLGAGVSLNFGIPNWNNLLKKLMAYTIEEEHKVSNSLSSIFNELFKPNPLIAGRYLQEYFENSNSSFEIMVRQVLYANIDKGKKSNILDEIVKLCVAPGKSPNIDAIITYNFDDILEYKLDKTDLDIPYKSIYGIGMDINNGELPIYHVHGYLPEEGNLTSKNNITFGENNYHKQYSDIYSWNNIVQINKFRENTCLFIGSSLTDPNIRRLLDIAYKQKGNKRKHHYIFKQRFDLLELKEQLKNSKNTTKLNNLGLDIDEVLNLINNIFTRFEENDSASFGVQTIWIDDWEKDVPVILRKIRGKIS